MSLYSVVILIAEAEQKPFTRDSVKGALDVHSKEPNDLPTLPDLLHIARKGREVHGGALEDCAALVRSQQLVFQEPLNELAGK